MGCVLAVPVSLGLSVPTCVVQEDSCPHCWPWGPSAAPAHQGTECGSLHFPVAVGSAAQCCPWGQQISVSTAHFCGQVERGMERASLRETEGLHGLRCCCSD